MHAVQISQEHILVLVAALVAGDVLAPAANSGRQTARDVGFLGDVGDGVEVGADGEDYAA